MGGVWRYELPSLTPRKRPNIPNKVSPNTTHTSRSKTPMPTFVSGVEVREFALYPEYWSVEDCSRIWNSRRQRWVVIGTDKDGRPSAKLRNRDGKYLKVGLSRHHAIAWLGPPPFPDAWVLHKDDDPSNNSLSNLYYGTQIDNAADRLRNRGDYLCLHKLKDSVVEIRNRLALGESDETLAFEFGVCSLTIKNIRLGVTWTGEQYASQV